MVVTRTDFRCTAPNSEHFVPISGKRPYLSQTADNQKNKGTLLSRTLKVGEEKVPSEFRFVAYWPRIGRFKIFAIQNQKQYLLRFLSEFLNYNQKLNSRKITKK